MQHLHISGGERGFDAVCITVKEISQPLVYLTCRSEFLKETLWCAMCQRKKAQGGSTRPDVYATFVFGESGPAT